MLVPLEKPGTPEELVVLHVGVKGMHWGIRKQEETSDDKPTSTKQPWSTKKKVAVGVGVTVGLLAIYGAYRYHTGVKAYYERLEQQPIRKFVKVDPNNIEGLNLLPKETQGPVHSAINMINKAYGGTINKITPISEIEEENTHNFGYHSALDLGNLHLSSNPKLKEVFSGFQDQGWTVSTPGHEIESLVTHEGAHAILHQNAWTAARKSIGKPAWDKAIETAINNGEISKTNSVSRELAIKNLKKIISQYASQSYFNAEAEAEIFSAYHWSPNPPKFVDAFMTTLHEGLGVTVNPFSGRII